MPGPQLVRDQPWRRAISPIQIGAIGNVQPLGIGLLPLLVYGAVAVAFTWPLTLHPASLLGAPVGPGDPYLYVWTLGWGMRTFLTHPADVFTGRVFDANIFHPATGTLTYSDHLLLQSALVAPVYALTGNAVLCYNIVLF